jgi:hypothetical protein
MVTSLTLRQSKGSTLTFTEHDANFSALRTTADAAVPRDGSLPMTAPYDFNVIATGSSVATSISSRFGRELYLEDFGVIGDGITDDTVLINFAASYCKANKRFLRGLGKNYKITNLVTLNCNGDFTLSTFKADATVVPNPIFVGGNNSEAIISSLDLALPRLINTSKANTGWENCVGSTGVLIGALSNSTLVDLRLALNL